MKLLLLAGALALLFAGCEHAPTKRQSVEDPGGTDQADAQRSREILYATLWMQHSAEYRAAALQAFESARAQLKSATKCGTAEVGQLQQTKGVCGAKSPWAKRPAAIIFDLDETLLDNSAYQAFQIRHRELYEDARWETWVKSEEALAIAGASEFANDASKLARIYYVTDRQCRHPIDKVKDPVKLRADCPQLLDTMSRMEKLGFPKADDRSAFYLKGMYAELQSKEAIRQKIAGKHRIVMLVGDNLTDFVENQGIYAQNEAKFAPLWGKRWFIVPNPAYGSWLDVLSADAGQEVANRCGALATDEEKEYCAYGPEYEARLAKLKVWFPLE